MTDGKSGPTANALAMARAILGGLRIVGASFRGNGDRSGVDGAGRAMLSTGRAGASGSHWTSYLDIDFVAQSDLLGLEFELSADAVPLEDPGRLLTDGLSLWINGRPVPMGPRPFAGGAGGTQARTGSVSGSGTGVRVVLQALVGLVPGQVNTIRIATGALGAAGILSVLTVTSAEAAPGGVPGNPNNGNNGNDDGVGNAGHDNGNGNGGGNGGGGGGTGGGMIANDDTVEIVQGTSVTVDLFANDIAPGQSLIFITAINGQEVEPGDTVVLSTGETITINADGTVTITADGDPSSFSFDYTAAYGIGNAQHSDTATVTVNTVPCFVAGTMIRTDRGDIPVERLKVGQLVMTRDDGLQPIRWIGRRTLPAEGRMAPVRIEKDAFGEHGALMVSPLHRILVANEYAELLFGTHEVLAAARDLIDGTKVRQIEGGQVNYVHVLFDRHQVVWSEGLMSESFLPGPQTSHCFEEETIAEICEIFPQLDPRTGAGYGPAARPTLRRFEARLLVA